MLIRQCWQFLARCGGEGICHPAAHLWINVFHCRIYKLNRHRTECNGERAKRHQQFLHFPFRICLIRPAAIAFPSDRAQELREERVGNAAFSRKLLDMAVLNQLLLGRIHR